MFTGVRDDISQDDWYFYVFFGLAGRQVAGTPPPHRLAYLTYELLWYGFRLVLFFSCRSIWPLNIALWTTANK